MHFDQVATGRGLQSLKRQFPKRAIGDDDERRLAAQLGGGGFEQQVVKFTRRRVEVGIAFGQLLAEGFGARSQIFGRDSQRVNLKPAVFGQREEKNLFFRDDIFEQRGCGIRQKPDGFRRIDGFRFAALSLQFGMRYVERRLERFEIEPRPLDFGLQFGDARRVGFGGESRARELSVDFGERVHQFAFLVSLGGGHHFVDARAAAGQYVQQGARFDSLGVGEGLGKLSLLDVKLYEQVIRGQRDFKELLPVGRGARGLAAHRFNGGYGLFERLPRLGRLAEFVMYRASDGPCRTEKIVVAQFLADSGCESAGLKRRLVLTQFTENHAEIEMDGSGSHPVAQRLIQSQGALERRQRQISLALQMISDTGIVDGVGDL
ncbi:MAG: hypothetical protein JMDDDDMK_00240 [Acidobacteria bacterium]|nr:hypothetical protein [Acidobacteriota bacterium]